MEDSDFHLFCGEHRLDIRSSTHAHLIPVDNVEPSEGVDERVGDVESIHEIPSAHRAFVRDDGRRALMIDRGVRGREGLGKGQHRNSGNSNGTATAPCLKAKDCATNSSHVRYKKSKQFFTWIRRW